MALADWDRFICTPSRYTAEPIEQEERARLLAQAKAKALLVTIRAYAFPVMGNASRSKM